MTDYSKEKIKQSETSTIIQTQKAIVISEGGGESPQEQLDMPTGTDAGGGDSSLAEIIAQIVNAPAQNNNVLEVEIVLV